MNNAKKVIAWVLGGLGNQMFQYAAAMAFAQQTRAQLELDVSQFDHYDLRSFDLALFGIKPVIWQGASPAFGLTGKILRAQQRLADLKLFPRSGITLLREEQFHYQDLPKLGWKNAYLFGFWQSPKYFSGIENDIRERFDLNRFDSPELPTASLSHPHSVSVHIRRGDYATNPETLRVHGICDDNWYHTACSLLKKINPQCEFHVFSDDHQEAERIFANYDNAVVHPRRSQEQDMFLMSKCTHHIIANSSFSWWAAWLGTNDIGHTIAPRRWFAEATMRTQNTADLFPTHWITL